MRAHRLGHLPEQAPGWGPQRSAASCAMVSQLSWPGSAPTSWSRRRPGCRKNACSCSRRTSDEADCAALVAAAVERFGRLNVLVNNARTALFGSFITPADAWRALMATNFEAVIHCTRSAMPHLLASRGNIVNISSVSGLNGDWGLSFYDASKAAVTNLTRALAWNSADEACGSTRSTRA